MKKYQQSKMSDEYVVNFVMRVTNKFIQIDNSLDVHTHETIWSIQFE
jgi:hypothetical protein